MDASLRNTPALIARIEKLRDELVKHFESLVGRAAVDKKTDRHATAITQFEMQVETAALIRAAQDVQTLVRTLQEMWLFGQLRTVGGSDVQARTDESAREVGALLEKLAERQGDGATKAEGEADGEGVKVDGK